MLAAGEDLPYLGGAVAAGRFGRLGGGELAGPGGWWRPAPGRRRLRRWCGWRRPGLKRPSRSARPGSGCGAPARRRLGPARRPGPARGPGPARRPRSAGCRAGGGSRRAPPDGYDEEHRGEHRQARGGLAEQGAQGQADDDDDGQVQRRAPQGSRHPRRGGIARRDLVRRPGPRIAAPRPTISTTARSPHHQVERSARSFVHSERTTRTWVSDPPTVAGAGLACAGANPAFIPGLIASLRRDTRCCPWPLA